MIRYLLILFATMALVIGAAWFWVIKSPISFLEANYAIFKAKMDMARTLPPDTVIILGDSRPLVGIVPAQLGPDVYNLAANGASPIEILGFARLVLAGPHPPRAVLLSISPFRCITAPAFWDEAVGWDLLDRPAIEEARVRSLQYPDDLVLGTNGHDRLDAAYRSPLFGPRSVGEVEARLKQNLYEIRFPSYYFAALAAGGIWGRDAGNRERYREVLETRGQILLWKDDGNRGLNPETTAASFAPSPLLDSYLSDLIDLFQQRKIPVYFIACPINEETAAALQPEFAEEFETYIRGFEKSHANFHVLGPIQDIRPWTDFGGDGHLNGRGARAFSDDVAARLRAAGIEK